MYGTIIGSEGEPEQQKKSWEEEFDENFPCIQSGCNNNGTILGSDGEPEQCEYCDKYKFPQKDFIRKAISEAVKEARWKILQKITGAIARAWCHPQNAKKEMDDGLAIAIKTEITAIINNMKNYE